MAARALPARRALGDGAVGAPVAVSIDTGAWPAFDRASVRFLARAATLSAVLLLALAVTTDARAYGTSLVFLNGVAVPVSFNDGDSFRVHAGEFNGSQCRLTGYNTLESFGPAHQWGTWHPYELYVISKMATVNGVRGTWHCTTEGARDGYGRLLVECPDLIMSQISRGFAHAYQPDDTPARPEFIRAQEEAIRQRRGMWAHGVPDYVMTSVHSLSEDPGRPFHYNRLISTHDGHTESYRHRETYGECEWVCNREMRADEAAVARAARGMRERLGDRVADWQNFHLLEFARRFARTGELPAYLTGLSQPPILLELTAARDRGELGPPRQARGSCMLYVDFERRYGTLRAPCLHEHGTVPPDVVEAP